MPLYRLIFEAPEGLAEQYGGRLGTASIESDKLYRVGDLIEYEGRRWRVAQAPTVDPSLGAEADLIVWPADD
jgi:hypothetical protein